MELALEGKYVAMRLASANALALRDYLNRKFPELQGRQQPLPPYERVKKEDILVQVLAYYYNGHPEIGSGSGTRTIYRAQWVQGRTTARA